MEYFGVIFGGLFTHSQRVFGELENIYSGKSLLKCFFFFGVHFRKASETKLDQEKPCYILVEMYTERHDLMIIGYIWRLYPANTEVVFRGWMIGFLASTSETEAALEWEWGERDGWRINC